MKKPFWLLNLLLIAAVAYVVSDLFLTFVGKKLTPWPSVPALSLLSAPTQQEVKSFGYYSIITERNLFNSAPEVPVAKVAAAPPPPPEPPKADLPLTKLNLKLVGTVSGKLEDSYAFIEDRSKRKQDLYRVGDKIQDAQVIDIARTKVILRNKGKDEVLLLYEEDKKNVQIQQTSAISQRFSQTPGDYSRRTLPGRGRGGVADQEPRQDSTEEQTAPESVTKEDSLQTISREEINKNVENLNQFMTQVRLRPYFVEGKPEGFMVSQIAQGSLLERIGLRSGDILKGVNGIPIDSPEKAFEVYQQLKEESTIVLDIERNKTLQTLTFNIQ